MNADEHTWHDDKMLILALRDQVDALRAALAAMLGAAETDCLDDKSNVWRSAMIDARTVLKGTFR